MTTFPKILACTRLSVKSLFILFLCTLFSFNLLAQQEETVLLRWKIAPKDSLMYKTIMETIETADSAKTTPTDTTTMSAAEKAQMTFLANMLQAITGADENTTLISKLKPQQGGIAVNMVYHKTDSAKTTMKSMYSEAFKMLEKEEKIEKNATQDSLVKEALGNINNYVDQDAVMLEGGIKDNGSIQSFYIDKNLKNTLALFFELPIKKVKIGDTWALDVQFITLNSEFECDSVFKTNQVTLTQLKKQGQDSIAVLKYQIQEFVSGKYPADDHKASTKILYRAVAEFSISQGRWLSYEGYMETDRFGSNEHKKYGLTKTD